MPLGEARGNFVKVSRIWGQWLRRRAQGVCTSLGFSSRGETRGRQQRDTGGVDLHPRVHPGGERATLCATPSLPRWHMNQPAGFELGSGSAAENQGAHLVNSAAIGAEGAEGEGPMVDPGIAGPAIDGSCWVVRSFLVVCLVFGALSSRAADDGAPGSVQGFADDVAAALRARCDAEGWHGPMRLLLDDTRGVDLTKARATLLPRVKKALKGLYAVEGALKARLALSEEGGKLWAVVVVDGPGLDGPSTIVVSAAVDRELSSALGAVSKLSQGRLLLERKGLLTLAPSCPVLDSALIDVDGDPALDLAVLTRCGVEVFRIDDAARLERIAGPWPLPQRRWPRVALGWLVAVPMAGERLHTLWAATSAGHSVFINVQQAVTDPLVDAPAERVPLRSVTSLEGPLALHWRFGSPALALPLISAGGIDVGIPGLPARVRDLVRYPVGDSWIFVAEDGSLLARNAAGAVEAVAPERCGDRILLVDIDADAEPELLTTSASAPGEPDQLVLRRLGPGLSSSTVLLKSPLSGGSIVGVAYGHIDFDIRLDVLIIEELASGDAQVWRLEHAP